MEHHEGDGCAVDMNTKAHWDPTADGGSWVRVASRVALVADGHPMQVFEIKDIHYTEDWVKASDPVLPEPRVLTLVGWAFRGDQENVHIAQLWDPETECFGGGVIVPTSAIISRKDVS